MSKEELLGGADTGESDSVAEASVSEPPREDFESQVARYARRPAGWRSPMLMLIVMGVCGWLMSTMYEDVVYFFADPTPIDLGCDEEGYDFSSAEHNVFVTIEGLPGFLQAQYKEFGTRYRVFQLIGTRVFVRERLGERPMASSDEHPVFVGQGLLLDLREERKLARLRDFFEQRGRFDFSEQAWILMSGVEPRKAWWWPTAFLLIGGILVLNLVMLARRLLRRR